jgi:hypothetical protein
MLISTQPKNEGERAALARSHQLTELVWTPVRDVPTLFQRKNCVLPAGVPVNGFPYASTEKTDKFITENVSIRTFLSAIKNPDSKLYQPGQAQYYVCNYGIVCNGLARYAFGIPYRVSTKCWETIPGMRRVADHGCYKAEDIRLLDVLYAFGEGRNHVALVTDILKDESGAIREIEVSDAVRPSCHRVRYDLDAFFEKWKLFHLDRYDYLADVPPVNEADAALLRDYADGSAPNPIEVDNGDFSNYLLGQIAVISTFTEGEDTVEIIRDGEIVEAYDISGRTMRSFEPTARGYYTARLKNNGAEVHFAFLRAKTSYTVENGSITVTADPCDEKSEIHYMDFRVSGESPSALAKYEVLSEEERCRGVITRKIPSDAGSFKVYYRNPYGIWTHPLTPIEK